MDTLLQQAVAAARAGNRQEARDLLMQIVEADERNEQAWLWLSGVVDDPEDMRTCLENVLDLNPGNEKARKGLAWLETRYGPRAAPAPAKPPQPATPETHPAEGSYTGPTTRLDPGAMGFAAVPLVALPQPAASAQPVASPPAPLPEHPCPYCGAATTLAQENCPQCRNSLMIRTAPREKRSKSLTVTGWLWTISGALSILGAILNLIAILGLQSALQRTGSGGLMAPLFTQGLGSLLGGFITFSLGRGLLKRRRWAYFGVIGILGLGMLITFGLALLSILVSGRSSPAERASGGNSVFIILGIVILVQLLYAWLLARSYGDFFGPKVRLLTEVEAHDHMTHYNNGVTYKNRGMWYMAVKEWEVASKKAPHDLNYLHALGLAYAQIRQFDQARATLDSALKIDPNHMRIRESRALVDEMAKR